MLHNSLLASYQDYFETIEGNDTIPHYDYPDVWTSFAKDALSSVFLYVAIALAAILLIVGLIVRAKRAESLPRFLRTAVSLACGFAGTVVITMLTLEFLDMKENGAVTDLLLYPAVTLGVVLVLAIAGCYVASLFSRKAFKIARIVSLSAVGAGLVATLVCMGVYYDRAIRDDGYYNGFINDAGAVSSVNQIVLYLSAIALLGIILLLAFLLGRKDVKGFDSRSISYAAICIAMSFALSYLRIFRLPQGGSVTIASLLPLMIYSYMFGVKKGVFAGFVYGLLQAIQDPWIIHPAQFLLDYPVAFSVIGLAGMFSKVKSLEKAPQLQFLLGAIVASVLRFISHLLSGVFAFSAYAVEEGMNTWVYSLAYNSFVFVDIAIVIVAGLLVFSSKSFVKQAKRFNFAPAAAPAAPEAPSDALPAQEGEAQTAPASKADPAAPHSQT